MRVHLSDRCRHRFLSPQRLKRAARLLLEALGRPEAELSLSLVDSQEMAELNARYRGRPDPTDVLAFGLADPICPQLLGEVVICPAQTRSPQGVLRCLVHGLLHLLGYDHPDEASWRLMRQEEDRLLELLER